jgi:clan AA aspartic protease
MGIVHASLSLLNPLRRDLAPMAVEALADTGAMHLCIPDHVAIQLDLAEQEKREVTLADGSRRLLPYVGPVEVRFANRRCFVGAMVLGDEVLLSAIPMEDLDLVVRPLTREVIVNPASPNVPSSLAKGNRQLS